MRTASVSEYRCILASVQHLRRLVMNNIQRDEDKFLLVTTTVKRKGLYKRRQNRFAYNAQGRSIQETRNREPNTSRLNPEHGFRLEEKRDNKTGFRSKERA